MVQRVGVVGGGPAVAAIVAATTDIDVETVQIEVDDVTDVDLALVVGSTDDAIFQGVQQERTGRWLAVELGGIGSQRLSGVDAAISLLGQRACYACVHARVMANTDTENGVQSNPTDAGYTSSDARFAGAVAGRLAVDVLQNPDTPDRVIEVPYVERHLMPAPGCSCDGDRDRTIRREFEPVGLEETAARAEEVVDTRLGMISDVGEVDSFPAPYYLATVCETTAFGDGRAEPHAAGVAAGWDGAFVKAIGEGLERYAAAVYDEDHFQWAPTRTLDDAVAPAAFVVPEEGYEPPDPAESIPWVNGVDLHDGHDVVLPAEFVHFPPPGRRHKPAITTGLGLGTSTIGALLSGLYETIERDATTIAWYSTFEPIELTIEGTEFELLTRRAESEDLTVTPLLVTQDIDVPVVSVAVHREEEWPKFAVGSAADLDPTAAATGALCEALQNWMELRRMGPERAAEEESAISRFADRPREAEAFLDATGSIPAASLANDSDVDGEVELDIVLDRLADVGLTAYASRLTTRDLEVVGFETARVLVPEAQPRFLGARFFGERAKHVPRDLGYRPRFDRTSGPYP